MEKSPKMNIFYKLSFIILMLCIVLFIVAVIVNIAFDNRMVGMIMSVVGVVLCFAAIIMTMLSSPKKQKQKKAVQFVEEDLSED